MVKFLGAKLDENGNNTTNIVDILDVDKALGATYYMGNIQETFDGDGQVIGQKAEILMETQGGNFFVNFPIGFNLEAFRFGEQVDLEVEKINEYAMRNENGFIENRGTSIHAKGMRKHIDKPTVEPAKTEKKPQEVK